MSKIKKWFGNMKIQNKLFASFGGLIAILIFLSAFSGFQLYSVDKKYSELITTSIGRHSSITKAVADIEKIFHTNLNKGYLVTVDADASEMARLHEDYKKYVESYKAYLEDYRSNMQTDVNLTESDKQEGMILLDEILYIFTYEYLPKIIEQDTFLYNNNQELYRIMGESMQIGEQLAEKMNLLYNMVSEKAEEISEITTAHSHQIIFLLFIIIAFLIFLSILMAIFMTQRIKTPIIQMENAMIEISNGNLAYPIRSDNTDEIGMLAGKIGDMVDSLYKTQEELRMALVVAEDSAKAKSEFLDNMNHELRTPMNGILGFLRIAQQDGTDQEKKENMERAEQSAKNLLKIIDDVLDFTEIEDKKMKMDAAPFILSDILKEIFEAYKSTIKDKCLDFNMRLPLDLPETMVGDSKKIKQIFTNLIDNAVKFTEKGKITVRGNIKHRDDKRIEMDFYVKDTGIGITPEQIKRLFMPFYQGDTSSTRKYGGIGLGLPLAKHLVNMLGGRIWVESECDEGSIFHFTTHFNLLGGPSISHEKDDSDNLPSPAQTTSITDEKTHDPNKTHLLIAEDVEINQIIVEELLTGMGYKLDIANNGKEAIDMLAQREYKAILMDIQMPIMDGLTAAKEIRKMEKFADLPIIAVSAHSKPSDIEKSLEYGMNDHITKPIDPDVLGVALNKWLNPAVV
jgi:signal transduction histidine kinase/CheY-like chemotaxis protein